MSRIFRKKPQAYSAVTSFMVPYNHWTGIGATGVTTPVPVQVGPRDLPRPGIKDLGLAIEPIVAIREFHIYPHAGMTLYSFNDAEWPEHEPIQAFCSNDPFADHEAPAEHCSCGIYAWNLDCASHCNGKLFGEVYLWGDVMVCDYGYRAEFAYPKSLTIRSTKTRAAVRIRDGLAAAYGVPVAMVEPTVSVSSAGGSVMPALYYYGSTSYSYMPPAGPTGPVGFLGT